MYNLISLTLSGLLQCGHLIPLWVTSDLRQLISKMTLRFCLSGSVSSTPTASAFFFAFFLAHSLVSTSYSSSLHEGVTLDVNMSIYLLKEHGFRVKVSWREDVSVDVDVEAPGVVEDETATETLVLDAVVVSAGSEADDEAAEFVCSRSPSPQSPIFPLFVFFFRRCPNLWRVLNFFPNLGMSVENAHLSVLFELLVINLLVFEHQKKKKKKNAR